MSGNISRPEWEPVFDMLQITYHRGDQLENDVMKSQAIHNHYQERIKYYKRALEMIRDFDVYPEIEDKFDDPGEIAIDALTKFI